MDTTSSSRGLDAWIFGARFDKEEGKGVRPISPRARDVPLSLGVWVQRNLNNDAWDVARGSTPVASTWSNFERRACSYSNSSASGK